MSHLSQKAACVLLVVSCNLSLRDIRCCALSNQSEAFKGQLAHGSLRQSVRVEEERQLQEVKPLRRLVSLCLVRTDMQMLPFAGAGAIWHHSLCACFGALHNETAVRSGASQQTLVHRRTRGGCVY